MSNTVVKGGGFLTWWRKWWNDFWNNHYGSKYGYTDTVQLGGGSRRHKKRSHNRTYRK